MVDVCRCRLACLTNSVQMTDTTRGKQSDNWFGCLRYARYDDSDDRRCLLYVCMRKLKLLIGSSTSTAGLVIVYALQVHKPGRGHDSQLRSSGTQLRGLSAESEAVLAGRQRAEA